MYISSVEIINYRCFLDSTIINFKDGVNVIIGENNSGKTTALSALNLVFNKSSRKKLNVNDFNRFISPSYMPPEITIKVTINSSEEDSLEEKAILSTWLTSFEKEIQTATLTYKYYLPDEFKKEFKDEIGSDLDEKSFWDTLSKFSPKYVNKLFCGNDLDKRKPDQDDLDKFDLRFLKAIRDVDSEMFSGTQPILREMLNQILDKKLTPQKVLDAKAEFNKDSSKIIKDLISRLDTQSLFSLVENVGVNEGGPPSISGHISEADILRALNIVLGGENNSIPLTQNGLGYNNLIYIALLLNSMEEASSEKYGDNAVSFSMLSIEEPEAHLHPALQYKLLKYLTKENVSKQIFMTTHSTHITSGAGLDPIIVLRKEPSQKKIQSVYPGRCFEENQEGINSKRYVQRFLDATKSNMLFSKGVIFVEGIAEQLLIPAIAEYMNYDLEKNHISVISVGGSTFKHFLPIFGCGNQDKSPFLNCKIACLPDGDPSRKLKNTKNARFSGCYPFQLDFNPSHYEYKSVSSVVNNLKTIINNSKNVKIFHSNATLEYDFALANSRNKNILTDACTSKQTMELLIDSSPDFSICQGINLTTDEEDELKNFSQDNDEQYNHVFALSYLSSVESKKGEHAFLLADKILDNVNNRVPGDFQIPQYIKDALNWICK